MRMEPLENMEFPASITHTFVNGNLVYEDGKWNESQKGQRLRFERQLINSKSQIANPKYDLTNWKFKQKYDLKTELYICVILILFDSWNLYHLKVFHGNRQNHIQRYFHLSPGRRIFYFP